VDAFTLRDRVLFGLAQREAELLSTVLANAAAEPAAVAERIARVRGLREAADIVRAQMETIT